MTHAAVTRSVTMLALAVGCAAVATGATPAPKPTGLAAGKAKGTLTVNARPAALGYAYAAIEANPFDEKKDDIIILLCDKPIPEDILAGKPLSDAASAAGVKNHLTVTFREDKDMAQPFGFLGRWVVGNRKIGHESLKEMTLQSSPDFNAKVDPVTVGADRVEATLYTKGTQADFEHKYEYRIAFNAKVKPRLQTAKLDPGNAQRLPAGGGAPGKAYLAFNKALLTGDIKTLKSMAPKGAPMPPDAELKKMLTLMAAMAPRDPKVVEGFLSGNKAVLTVEAMVAGQKQKGTIEMALDAGVWTTGKESWK
jgi:hypothetical protein